MSAPIHRGGRPAKISAVPSINNATTSSSSGGIEITPRHSSAPISVRPSTAPLKRKDAPQVTASPVASSPAPSVAIGPIVGNGAGGGRGGHQNKKPRPRSAPRVDNQSSAVTSVTVASDANGVSQHQNGSRGGGRGGRGGGRGRRGRGGRGGSGGNNHHNSNGASAASAPITEGDAMDENDDAEPDAAPTESKVEVKEGKLAFMTDEPFSSLKPSLSVSTLKALTDTLGYIYMTRVQAAAMPTIITGSDVLARARTGTGKTLGFLIPSVEVIIFHSIISVMSPC
jgi:hypothetical protein